MAHAQARVAKALLVVVGATHPAAQEPVQFLPRVIQCAAVHSAQLGVARLQVHQVIKALHQRLQGRLAAYQGKGAVGGGRADSGGGYRENVVLDRAIHGQKDSKR